MGDYEMFTCFNCKYSARTVREPGCVTCSHPAVVGAGISGRTLITYTPEDFHKINFIINDVLKMDITTIDNSIPNFEFPYKFDAVWINRCGGYIKKIRIKGKDVKKMNTSKIRR